MTYSEAEPPTYLPPGDQPMNPILAAAIELAESGIPVFPCLDNKRPATANGFKAATLNPASIWTADATLIGVPTGEASGFDVLDIDIGKCGDVWLAENVHKLPPTRWYETRSGGRHILFRHAPGVRNSASRIARGVDVRGDGGYVINWPSTGSFATGMSPIAEWPEWLLQPGLVLPKAKPEASGESAQPMTIETSDIDAFVAKLLARITNAEDGEKHATLRDVSRLFGGILHATSHDFDAAHAMLMEALPSTVGDWHNAGETATWGLKEGCTRPIRIVAPGGEFGIPAEPESSTTVDEDWLRARLTFPADCEAGEKRGYIVKHLLAPGDVGALIGAPSTGKSVLAPHIAYAVAQGRTVFGLRVKPGRVLYIAAEDGAGMRQRIHALKLRHGDAPEFATMECGNLRDPETERDIRQVVEAWNPALVVIDTVGAAFAGMDENSSQDMGQVVAVARRLANEGHVAGGAVRTAVLLIHHTAKAGDGTPRGHSVLNGTLDMSLRLEPADNGVIRARLGKNRNGSTERDMAFRIGVVDLCVDDDGDTVTAPVAHEMATNTVWTEKLSPTEAAALALLVELAAKAADSRVLETEWRAACDDSRVSTADSEKSRKDVMRRAYAGLIRKGRIAAGGGFVWVAVASEFNAEPSDSSDSRAIVATVAEA